MKVELYFNNMHSPQLDRISVHAPFFDGARVSLRGKESNSRGHGSFQWSSAVKALVLLLLKAKISPGNSSICSTETRYAKSLDYAIEKQPVWMTELFGSDKNGISNFRRMVNRSNPSSKRQTNTSVAFKNSYVPKVLVYAGERELDSLVELNNLCKSIANVGSENEISKSPFPFNSKREISFLTEIIAREMSIALSPRLLRREVAGQALEELVEGQASFGIADLFKSELVPLFPFKSRNEELGIRIDGELSSAPCKIAIPKMLVGTIALVRESAHKGYLFSERLVDTSIELIELVKAGDIIDAVVLSAPASRQYLQLLLSLDYCPAILMPSGSTGLLARDGCCPQLTDAHFSFLNIPGSSSVSVMGKICRKYSLKKVDIRHCQLGVTENFYRQTSEDELRLLPFPASEFRVRYAGDSFVNLVSSEILNVNSILWLKGRNLLSSRSQLIILRDIWLALLESPESILRVARELSSDIGYQKFLTRGFGIFPTEINKEAA